MSNNDDKLYQKGLIITDDKAVKPILDFDLYRNAIVNIIKNSYPKFTIGIFGDWGTGKTTLMYSIKNELEKQENIMIVWFDAWKYENEKEFALIPLLKTINYSIKDDNDENKKNLKEALKESAIFTLGISSDILSSVITNYAGMKMGTFFKRSLEDATTKLIPKLKELNSLSEIDKNTIFYNGINNIQKAIEKLQENKPKFRFVIFIDDLDRCSEEKILEILESIKIFLSLNGIIYVLGISHDRVVELINKKYQTNNGENYIKKIIQIPITLPKWINTDIVELVKDLIKKGIINTKYQDIFNEKNITLISEAIENNPREIKRFLNNFIVAFEIFSSKQNFNSNELLMIQVIQLRWNNFYNLLIYSENDFRKKLFIEIKKYLEVDEEKRLRILDSDEVTVEESKRFDMKVRKVLHDLKIDTDLWKILKKNFDTLNNIQDWNIYRRAIEVTKGPTSGVEMRENEILMLLKSGKIREFNNRRNSGEISNINLSHESLIGANLAGANLTNANLMNTNLTNANLIGANLLETNCMGANLTNANLTGANIINANLTNANLTDANLNRAYLLDAKLIEVILTGANLTGADLMGATISNSILYDIENYEKLIINQYTKFNNSIANNQAFIEYLQNTNLNITIEKIEEKSDLKKVMLEKEFSPMVIDYTMSLNFSIAFILQLT